jgi:hypothetical protein
MKIRQGFVSNSSSSSFIVGRAQIGDEKFIALASALKENRNDGNFWPEIGSNYIYVDVSECDLSDIINAVGLKDDDYMIAGG